MRRTWLLMLCPIVALGACHAYTPAGGQDMLADERVRLEFTAPRTIVFGSGPGAPSIGPVARVEGVIVQMPQDSLRLRVSGAWDVAGESLRVPANGLTTIARRDLVATDRRAMSRGRTALVVGAAAVAFVAVLALAFGGD